MAREESIDLIYGDLRVLDLAGEMGTYCGKLLADLGAEVIKVEKPGGDPTRRIGPFLGDDPHPEKSLYWFQFNTSKKSITLDIATLFFAHYGAEVIRLESRAKLDGLRRNPPYFGGIPGQMLPESVTDAKPNLSGYYADYNSNKFSILVNLNLPQGQAVARRLIKISDIAIDNFTPRVMEKWGLGHEEIMRVRPDIIVAKLPMMGMTGPHRDDVGFGFALAAVSGINHLSGMPDDPPVGTGTNFPDYSANPCHAAVALLVALRHRRRTGKGQYIELAQIESTVQVLETAILDYTMNGRNQSRQGNRLQRACPHGAYPCKGEDRWCVIAVFTDAEWATLCRTIGREDLIVDPHLGALRGRLAHMEEVDRLASEWTRDRSAEEAMETLQAAGISAGVVQTSEDVLDKDPQLAARGHWVYLDHPDMGRTAYDGDAFKLSLTPGHIHAAAPCLGQHTDWVCRELLGLTVDEVAALKEEKVLY